MSAMELSYSLLVMTHDRIYALRDPYGNRPLCIGELPAPASAPSSAAAPGPADCLAFVASSESCAFPAGTRFHSEVEPGEMVEISRAGIKSVWQVSQDVVFKISLLVGLALVLESRVWVSDLW